MTQHTSDVMMYVPYSYITAKLKDRRKVCNGCGPDNILGQLISDHIYDLSITEACNVHDWMYHKGGSEADRAAADETFEWNLKALVDCHWTDDDAHSQQMRADAYDIISMYVDSVIRFGGVCFNYHDDTEYDSDNVVFDVETH